MELEPGTRVRCVDAYGSLLQKGCDYVVEYATGDEVYLKDDRGFPYRRDRFKPVIRVNAPTRKEPSSTELLLDAMFGKL